MPQVRPCAVWLKVSMATFTVNNNNTILRGTGSSDTFNISAFFAILYGAEGAN
jgi:hypothetical protein